ncbi:hypothetical protein Tco_0805899 [Tanacetum coccineum]
MDRHCAVLRLILCQNFKEILGGGDETHRKQSSFRNPFCLEKLGCIIREDEMEYSSREDESIGQDILEISFLNLPDMRIQDGELSGGFPVVFRRAPPQQNGIDTFGALNGLQHRGWRLISRVVLPQPGGWLERLWLLLFVSRGIVILGDLWYHDYEVEVGWLTVLPGGDQPRPGKVGSGVGN